MGGRALESQPAPTQEEGDKLGQRFRAAHVWAAWPGREPVLSWPPSEESNGKQHGALARRAEAEARVAGGVQVDCLEWDPHSRYLATSDGADVTIW